MYDFLYENLWRGVSDIFYIWDSEGCLAGHIFKAVESGILGGLAAFHGPWLLFIFSLVPFFLSLSIADQVVGIWSYSRYNKRRQGVRPPVRPLGQHKKDEGTFVWIERLTLLSGQTFLSDFLLAAYSQVRLRPHTPIGPLPNKLKSNPASPIFLARHFSCVCCREIGKWKIVIKFLP